MRRLLFLLVLASMSSCRGSSAPAERVSASAPPTTPQSSRGAAVVTVNGTAIREAEVAAAMAAGARTGPNPHEGREGHAGAEAMLDREAVVETLVRQEVAAQRAKELGLDADPVYREQLGKLEAQVETFRRRELAALLERHLASQVKITDEEVQRYIDENQAKLSTEVRVLQILLRDRAKLEQAHKDLTAGTPFEEVAARGFPAMPSGKQPPWDLGYLRWVQLPEEWRATLETLPVGAVSPILAGPRNRGWILKLADRRTTTPATVETAGAVVRSTLLAKKVEAARAELERQLRGAARLDYASAPQR